MAPLKEFESILKDVVQAKRLSASKMGKLTEIALKTMDHDTQLVSILYRTHKSLPTAAKVSSLYVFDALSRAARHQVTKLALTGDINSDRGNCATFLLKVEGVLEGLFQDMITVGSSESKEKTKKILDIWVKGNTFPSAILSRLTEVVNLKEAVKAPEVNPITTADPRTLLPASSPSAPSQSPLALAMDPQSTLLALLTQAAKASAVNPGQIAPNTGTGSPPIDVTQLAMLQQLAQSASIVPTSQSTSLPTPLPPPTPSFAAESNPRSPTYRDHSVVPDTKFDRYRSPDRGKYDDNFDNHQSSRGSYRGGFRGRGRGRWDDRDRDRYRDRDRERSPPRRGGRSRSRSPSSRYGGRRDVRLYSPPRRPSVPLSLPRERIDNTELVPGVHEIEKDEFGRDIRPQSPENTSKCTSDVISTQSPTPAPPASSDKPTVESPLAVTSNHEQMSLSPLVAANTSSSIPSASFVSNIVPSQPGMEKFDLATFDFTAASSWEALGEMWQVTHGYLPTTEQLMQFVMSAGQGSSTSQPPPAQERSKWESSGTSGQPFRGGRGRGDFSKGRGGFGHGKGRNAQDGWYHDDNNATDAIVLGGGTDLDEDMQSFEPDKGQNPSEEDGHNGGLGGRMQRIGDKWVFVRDQGTS